MIASLMRRVTGCAPKMWGPSFVGFGSYRYEYASGHSGDMCLAGLSSRGREIVVDLMPEFEGRAGADRSEAGALHGAAASTSSMRRASSLSATRVGE
ncbi:MAG: hypothetical protein ACYDBY_02975 [Thermoanaerobaculia bacterium]